MVVYCNDAVEDFLKPASKIDQQAQGAFPDTKLCVAWKNDTCSERQNYEAIQMYHLSMPAAYDSLQECEGWD